MGTNNGANYQWAIHQKGHLGVINPGDLVQIEHNGVPKQYVGTYANPSRVGMVTGIREKDVEILEGQDLAAALGQYAVDHYRGNGEAEAFIEQMKTAGERIMDFRRKREMQEARG